MIAVDPDKRGATSADNMQNRTRPDGEPHRRHRHRLGPDNGDQPRTHRPSRGTRGGGGAGLGADRNGHTKSRRASPKASPPT